MAAGVNLLCAQVPWQVTAQTPHTHSPAGARVGEDADQATDDEAEER